MNWRAHDTAVSHLIVSSDEPGLRLHLRMRGEGGPPVLFVHGATYASRLYDIPHPGASWLEATARAGFCAYAVDVRGFGRSHSKAMTAATRPYGRAREVIRDIDDAVRWICDRHGTEKIVLAGGSWGSIAAGLFASTIGRGRVERLMLYAPIFAERNEGWIGLLADPEDQTRFSPHWTGCRRVDEAGTRARWDAEITAPDISDWRDEAVLQALVQSSLSDDRSSGDVTPPAFRAPNGAYADLWDAFNGRPLYDPAMLDAPLLLLRASNDPTSTRSDAMAVLERAGSVRKTYAEVANGSHFASAERRASDLFALCNGFLLS